MLLKIEDINYSEAVYKIGLLTLILNNIEYQLKTTLKIEEGSNKTLGAKIKILEEDSSVNLLYWKKDIIFGIKKINEERKIFIHGCSFINPHVNDGDSKIEFYKNGENKEFNMQRLDQAITSSKDILEKLLCIYFFYKKDSDYDIPMEVYNEGLFKKTPFTFYPESQD